MSAFNRLIRLAATAALACLASQWAHAAGTSTLQRIQRDNLLKVCIWPDYYGITFRNPRTQQLVGIDVDLSAAFAKDLNTRLEYVDSSFPTLIDDLVSGKCDIAMFAIGILPQRQKALAFSKPYLESDIFGVTTRTNRYIRDWADLDKPGVRVAVQAGTFMEPVMAGALKQAELVVIRPPQTREQELEAGRVDVFMTDYPYSRRLLDNADWARLIAPPTPYHMVQYAYAVKPGDDRWLEYVNAFVDRIKADGRLLESAKRYGLAGIVVRQ